MMISVTAAEYVFFTSFRTGCVITLAMVWVAISTARAVGAPASIPPFGGSGFAFYPYAMSAFTGVAAVRGLITSRRTLERALFGVWIAVLVVGCVPVSSGPSALLLCQFVSLSLISTEAVLALLITIDLARPIYREARLQRIA